MDLTHSFASFSNVVFALLLGAIFVLAWRFVDRLLQAWIRSRFPTYPLDRSNHPQSAWTRATIPANTDAYRNWLFTLRAAAVDVATHSSSSRTRMRELKRIVGELTAFETAHHIPVTPLKSITPATRVK
jgi:hypothetical protein